MHHVGSIPVASKILTRRGILPVAARASFKNRRALSSAPQRGRTRVSHRAKFASIFDLSHDRRIDRIA
jgi:hypothetical protein